jgi:hypothetical protein
MKMMMDRRGLPGGCNRNTRTRPAATGAPGSTAARRNKLLQLRYNIYRK